MGKQEKWEVLFSSHDLHTRSRDAARVHGAYLPATAYTHILSMYICLHKSTNSSVISLKVQTTERARCVLSSSIRSYLPNTSPYSVQNRLRYLFE